MKDVIKVGIVGLGRRGSLMLEHNLSKMSDVETVMICDLIEERMERGKELLAKENRTEPICTKDYHDILNNKEIDAVFFFNGWDGRTQMAMESMRAGKYTGVEVGCPETLEECLDVVRTYEETGVPIMMLENGCYDKKELTFLNMIRQGVFGDIIHCTGGYGHHLVAEDLFREMVEDKSVERITHYRLQHYIDENCHNYPTHDLGPISKALRLNRGNRMVRLNSVATKSAAIKQYAKDTFGEDNYYANIDYKQGDIVYTFITCENGETIQLTLDTTLPRPFYSMHYTIRGTKGVFHEDGKAVLINGEVKYPVRDNMDEYLAKYEHPLQREVRETESDKTKFERVFGAHPNGIDWLTCRAFIESVKLGVNTPIDAYDTASWMAIGPLSRMSIEQNGAPVEVPDFTFGKYKNREPVLRIKYCLDEVVEDNETTVYGSLIP